MLQLAAVDGTDANSISEAEVEGRLQLSQIVDAIVRYSPGFE